MFKLIRKYEIAEPQVTFDQVVKKVDGRNVLLYQARTKDINEGLLAKDFQLQSLIDADAIDLLQPTPLLTRGLFTVADFAEYTAVNLGSLADSIENNEVKKDEE